jgi:hypothetical protein
MQQLSVLMSPNTNLDLEEFGPGPLKGTHIFKAQVSYVK